jgi:ppGpp synthetase/RelA/SpoT-type nucleotidyltranferase
MQDIAGCRIVVPDLLTQDDAVERLKTLFDSIDIDDRRENASHGYRAIHIIVDTSGKLIEVQVRTSLQHLWAEVSEKLSDVDPLIKYGAGDQDMLSILNVMSQKINDQELAEAAHLKIMDSDDDEDEFQEGPKFAELMAGRLAIVRMLEAIREVVPRMKGREQ